jgi:glycosyltransferase involved in cell wall biosynthesis
MNRNIQLTIFTPTYNRAFTLPLLYESLKNQSNKSFKWLIIDDGSTDNTKELINKWTLENFFDIKYIYQKNSGMVAAHNTAQYMIDTELNICIDSDDYMPNDAVGKILDLWNKYGNDKYMGLVGLDSYKNGKIIGDIFPNNIYESTYSEIYYKYKINGDKKFIIRSELIKKVLPYPKIENEKFPDQYYLYWLLEKEYKFLLFNEIFCIVEYLPDGNSMSKIKQYKENPNAFLLYRREKMKFASSFDVRFRNAIHYISSSLFAKKYNILNDNPYKFTILLALPIGILLFFYLKNTDKKAVNEKLNNE